ncbi:MAG: RNA methyltransferase [Spirochaetales bacterium]|nr:RNA methyltransferase [Spirochaetales bacterium]
MNIVLFEKEELTAMIPASDYRCRHIREVLKLSEGDLFRAGIIGGMKGKARLLRLNSAGMELSFEAETNGMYSIPVELLIGHPRPPAVKRILKDATSAGVRSITFFIAGNSEKSYLKSSLWGDGEYRKALREGAEQGGHCFLPDVQVCSSLDWFFRKNNPDCERKIAFEFSANRVFPLDALEGRSFLLAVGPERGWTALELEMLSAGGFQFSGLGDTILRTETACTSALAIVSAVNNFFRK